MLKTFAVVAIAAAIFILFPPAPAWAANASDFTYYTYRGAGLDTVFVGPVLYAGAEVIWLQENPKLQISVPKPNAVNSALLMEAKD